MKKEEERKKKEKKKHESDLDLPYKSLQSITNLDNKYYNTFYKMTNPILTDVCNLKTSCFKLCTMRTKM